MYLRIVLKLRLRQSSIGKWERLTWFQCRTTLGLLDKCAKPRNKIPLCLQFTYCFCFYTINGKTRKVFSQGYEVQVLLRSEKLFSNEPSTHDFHLRYETSKTVHCSKTNSWIGLFCVSSRISIVFPRSVVLLVNGKLLDFIIRLRNWRCHTK